MLVALALLLSLVAQPSPADRLADALARYDAVEFRGGWGTVPDGPLVRPGEADPAQVPALRRRLDAEGALGAAISTGDALNPPLVEALRRTQERLGLDPDGVLGPKTRAALNVPAADRAAQVRAALADLETLGLPTSGRWVLVNIPEFRVRAFEGGREALSMKAVVGADADGWRTPTFSDQIEYLVFRPFWNVPTSIALNELVPQGAERLERDGFQLVRQFSPDAEVFPMTEDNLQRVVGGHLLIRQAAGPSNALGLVKIMFPNANNVYLHDTPAKAYFGRDDRALSHGCVRLAEPAAMGGWLLGRSEAEVRALMEGAEYRVETLAQRVPVVIAYLPAWPGDDGAVWFGGDPYGRLG